MAASHPHAANRQLSDSQSSLSSSGHQTPVSAPPESANSSFITSSIYGAFGGLMRRLSSEPSGLLPTQSTMQHHHGNGINSVYTPSSRRSVSPMRPPPLEPLILRGFHDDTPVSARLLTPAVAEEIRIMIPERLRIEEDWKLVYSLDQDGASLSTLYGKCSAYEGRRGGFVLVVRDDDGGTFGAYLTETPHISPHYFGTGECFLWRASLLASLPPPPSADTTHLAARTSTISSAPAPLIDLDDTVPSEPQTQKLPPAPHPPPSPSIRFKAFPYSGVNEYYIYCEPHALSVGGGDGKYGLWLDDSLARGVSSTCLTFGNEPLSDQGVKFGVLGVEVWVIGSKGL